VFRRSGLIKQHSDTFGRGKRRIERCVRATFVRNLISRGERIDDESVFVRRDCSRRRRRTRSDKIRDISMPRACSERQVKFVFFLFVVRWTERRVYIESNDFRKIRPTRLFNNLVSCVACTHWPGAFFNIILKIKIFNLLPRPWSRCRRAGSNFERHFAPRRKYKYRDDYSVSKTCATETLTLSVFSQRPLGRINCLRAPHVFRNHSSLNIALTVVEPGRVSRNA